MDHGITECACGRFLLDGEECATFCDLSGVKHRLDRCGGCDHLLLPGNGTCVRCGLPASAETSLGDRITIVLLLAGLAAAWIHLAWRALS